MTQGKSVVVGRSWLFKGFEMEKILDYLGEEETTDVIGAQIVMEGDFTERLQKSGIRFLGTVVSILIVPQVHRWG